MRLSAVARLLVVPVLLAIGLTSTAAQARQNHCDHSRGKARGTIIGGIVGAGLGALVGRGSTEGILIGGGAGAIGGRVIGDSEDDRRDVRDCGEDAESYQRQVDRDQNREDRAYAREERRSYEISRDRYDSRARRAGSYRPSYRPAYVCAEIGRGALGLVDTRTESIVEFYGRDLRSCKNAEARANY